MIELLILYILRNLKATAYEVRKIISNKFVYLATGTLGSVHPAIKKLVTAGYILEKKALTQGGRRKFTYTISKSGQKYFEQLMLDEIDNSISSKYFETKLTCLDALDIEKQKEFLKQ